MLPHLAILLQNNKPPSEEVIKEVKDLLSKPLQDLQNKDLEIERLKKTLNDLNEERDAIQKLIDEYTTILSPVRRIPPDIIHEIFYQCLPTHRNAIMSNKEAPLLLTRICRSWRTIAQSFHRIWAKLHIPLLPDSASHVNYYPYPHSPALDVTEMWERQQELHARVMQTRCKLAELWLSRSGSCPLSLSLNFIGGTDGQDIDLDHGNPSIRLFMTILSFSHRLSDIELTLSYEMYQVLETKFSPEMLPGLRKLKIKFSELADTPHGPEQPKRSIKLLQAPGLQSLSLSTANIMAFDSSTIPSTWENLTFLVFNSAITSAEVVQLLRRCQNLGHCKLIISDCRDIHIGPEDTLSLPHMQFLSIHVGSTDLMEHLYRRIDAPILHSFDYQKHYPFPFTNDGYGHLLSPSSPVIHLLEKYDGVKKLSFDPRILSVQDIHFSLRLANQITHLVLGLRPRNGSCYAEFGPYLGPGNFSLDLLIIGEDSTSGVEKEVLLSKLEVFEAYQPATNFSDETLQRFILSRLDPGQKEATPLRTVKVNFDRPRVKNIEEEVYRRAKQVGVKIKLDLHYFVPPKPPAHFKYLDIFSPWYGLTENDRSWNFADAEAEDS